jgi:hypothetical protein
MAKLKAGDLFAIPLPDARFLTGRVVLDVAQVVKGGLVNPGSTLAFQSGSILAETYRQISETPSAAVSEVLIPGIFIDKTLFSSRQEAPWRIIGHQPIEPTRVEFPEALYGSKRGMMFNRGELDLPVPLGHEALDRFNIRPGTLPAKLLADICLYHLGLKALIRSPNAAATAVQRSDLRFSEQRDEIYRLMGEDPKQSYYEMASRHGYDTARLYR